MIKFICLTPYKHPDFMFFSFRRFYCTFLFFVKLHVCLFPHHLFFNVVLNKKNA